LFENFSPVAALTVLKVSAVTDDLIVLLVASDPTSVALVGEAFDEMAELRFRRNWRGFNLTLVESLEEAEQYLAQRGVDSVLLSLAAVSEALPAFRRLSTAAPQAAIIVLAEPDEEQTALDLVRLGAQDYLLSSEIDCEPLAHTIRCSVERKRLTQAREQTVLMDGLTGLYNQQGLSQFTQHYAQLAARHGLRLLRVEAGLPPVTGGDSDLAALRVSDALRDAFEPTDIVARTGPGTFSAVALVTGADEAAAAVNRLASLLPPGTQIQASAS
jgi:DNA-binding NarL/FixJ family response regulator